MGDPYDLARFVAAQNDGGSFARALDELRAGSKRSHWMWWVFPQIAGLGRSPTSQRFALGSLAEAQAYVAHPVLGPRLLAATRALLVLSGVSAFDVFGGVDALKLSSSMTLFEAAAPDEAAFGAVLDGWFEGRRDAATLERL